MKVYYEETYGNYYDVDADNPEAAEKELLYLIGEGKENGPDQCENSVVVPLIGNGNLDFQIMSGRIDAMGEDEKKFYLWHLLRYYYKPRLIEGKKKYADNHDTVDMIDSVLDAVDAIEAVLWYEIY